MKFIYNNETFIHEIKLTKNNLLIQFISGTLKPSKQFLRCTTDFISTRRFIWIPIWLCLEWWIFCPNKRQNWSKLENQKYWCVVEGFVMNNYMWSPWKEMERNNVNMLRILLKIVRKDVFSFSRKYIRMHISDQEISVRNT